MRLGGQMIALVVASTVLSVGLFAAAAGFVGVQDLSEARLAEQQATTELAAAELAEGIREPAEALTLAARLIPDDELYPSPDKPALQARFSPLVPAVLDQVLVVGPEGDVWFALPAFAGPYALGNDSFEVTPDALHWQVEFPQRDDPPFLVGRASTTRLVEPLFVRIDQSERPVEYAVVVDDAVVEDTMNVANVASLAEAVGPHVETRSTIEGTDLELVAFASNQAIVRLQERIVLQATLAGFVVMVGGVGVGYALSRRVTGPIREVESALERLRTGDLDARVSPTGATEVRNLGTGVNAMAQALQQDRAALLGLQRTLESKVVARTEDLERTQREMEQFFYGVSHDIKGPVIGIAAMLQLLEERMAAADPVERSMVEKARTSASNLTRLIEDLLQFAAADRMEIKPERFSIRRLLKDIDHTLGTQAAARGLSLRMKAGNFSVVADRSVVQRATMNLVRNAIVHMPKGRSGSIEVHAARRGNRLIIAVQDDGAGIPEDVQERLFAPFARGATENRSGSGLGLSIVRKLVLAHGGNVTLTSKVGEGSTFTLVIPNVAGAKESGR